MAKILLSGAAALALATGALAAPAAAGETYVTRDLPAFYAIEVDGGLEMHINVGGKQSVEVYGNRDADDQVTTRVKNNILLVETHRSTFKSDVIKVTVTVPQLTSLMIDGAGEFVVNGINTPDFRMTLDGAGEVVLKGACGKATLLLDGAGELNAKGLRCKDVKATLDGAGELSVYASAVADVTLDGFGEVNVFGNPATVRKDRNGFGSISISKAEER